jgi:hypothetical protein
MDGGGIQAVHRVVKFHGKRLVGVEPAGTADQQARQVGPDAPVTRLVGLGQCDSAYGAAQAHAVKLVRIGAQHRLDVAQALAPSQLCKCHDAELLGAVEAAHPIVATVALHDAAQARPGYELHQLREQRLALVHRFSRRV